MNHSSTAELQLHYSILENKENFLPALKEFYQEHLVACLHQWYGPAIVHDASLVHEAVYETFRYYMEHPRTFNPAQGSLKGFLEIAADKIMQSILERENQPVQQVPVQHVLARYFDNELDLALASLVINKVDNLQEYISLLNIGSYRMAQQLVEVRRQTERIRKTLIGVPLPAPARKRKTPSAARRRVSHLVQH